MSSGKALIWTTGTLIWMPGARRAKVPSKSIEHTRCRRHQRKILQGTEADLHYDTMVQFCGAPPPPCGEPSRHWWGDYKGGGVQDGQHFEQEGS